MVRYLDYQLIIRPQWGGGDKVNTQKNAACLTHSAPIGWHHADDVQRYRASIFLFSICIWSWKSYNTVCAVLRCDMLAAIDSLRNTVVVHFYCRLTWYVEKLLPSYETRVVHESKKVGPGEP